MILVDIKMILDKENYESNNKEYYKGDIKDDK